MSSAPTWLSNRHKQAKTAADLMLQAALQSTQTVRTKEITDANHPTPRTTRPGSRDVARAEPPSLTFQAPKVDLGPCPYLHIDEIYNFSKSGIAHENQAYECETKSDRAGAIQSYTTALEYFGTAECMCPEWHQDKPRLRLHIAQLERRCRYLCTLKGSDKRVPLEKMIDVIELSVSPSQGVLGGYALGFAYVTGGLIGSLSFGPFGGLFLGIGSCTAVLSDNALGAFARCVSFQSAKALVFASRRASKNLARYRYYGFYFIASATHWIRHSMPRRPGSSLVSYS